MPKPHFSISPKNKWPLWSGSVQGTGSAHSCSAAKPLIFLLQQPRQGCPLHLVLQLWFCLHQVSRWPPYGGPSPLFLGQHNAISRPKPSPGGHRSQTFGCEHPQRHSCWCHSLPRVHSTPANPPPTPTIAANHRATSLCLPHCCLSGPDDTQTYLA